MSDSAILLLFAPWAFCVALAHVAKRDFRAYLRRQHPRAYHAVYGTHADRSRHSALDPVAWLLQLRFELSPAHRAFGDHRLDRLAARLRLRLGGAVALYCVALGTVVLAASR